MHCMAFFYALLSIGSTIFYYIWCNFCTTVYLLMFYLYFFWTTTIYNYQHQPTSSGIIIDHVSDYIELTGVHLSCWPATLVGSLLWSFLLSTTQNQWDEQLEETSGNDKTGGSNKQLSLWKCPLSINSKQQQRHTYKAYKMWDGV